MQQEQPETAREAAKHFIRPYVLDNWTMEELTKKRPSTDRDEYAARIGGGQIRDYRDQEHTVSREQIAVTRVGARRCWGLFDLAHIMAEIRDEARGYQQQTLAAIFAQEQERIAQAEREEEQERATQEAPRKRPAIFRSYNGGYCQNPACGAELGYIETDGGRDRHYCNNACRVAAHRARKREKKRAAILQYNSELREYWYENRVEGQLLAMLQNILIDHGKKAALAATNAALLARKEQIRVMGLANQYRPEPRPPRSTGQP